MPCSKFTFDETAFPFSALQQLTLVPLSLFLPTFISSNSISTVQSVSRFALHLFQSSTVIETGTSVAPNCLNFQVLHTHHSFLPCSNLPRTLLLCCSGYTDFLGDRHPMSFRTLKKRLPVTVDT